MAVTARVRRSLLIVSLPAYLITLTKPRDTYVIFRLMSYCLIYCIREKYI
jgi:hypothetical protein